METGLGKLSGFLKSFFFKLGPSARAKASAFPRPARMSSRKPLTDFARAKTKRGPCFQDLGDHTAVLPERLLAKVERQIQKLLVAILYRAKP